MSFQYSGGREQSEQAALEHSGGAVDTTQRAFVELHGRSLHGFALLMCLGDERHAAQLTTGALARGLERLDEMPHLERAAAWLRSQVYRDWIPAHRAVGLELPEILASMGLEAPVLTGLAAVGGKERAALIAGDIERLDRRDAALVIAADEREFARVLARARRRYVDAFVKASGAAPVSEGPIVRHVQREKAKVLT